MKSNQQTRIHLFWKLCLPCLAIGLAAVPKVSSQQLQKGVSVDLAPTNNAHPMPAADDENAWVVTVSSDGRLWFGADLMSRDGLAEKMMITPRKRDQNLYIKADARAPYSDVQYVLKAAHSAEFDAPVLLTGQHESPRPGTMVPPKGLEVSLESGAIAGPKPAEVEVSSGAQTVKLNNQQVSMENLPATLKTLFQNQTENTVLLKADRDLPFAQVARAIDACRSAGAKVVLVTPQT